jgi:hypothetical protein
MVCTFKKTHLSYRLKDEPKAPFLAWLVSFIQVCTFFPYVNHFILKKLQLEQPLEFPGQKEIFNLTLLTFDMGLENPLSQK